MKVDNIITRAAHYESFTMSGAGYILNDGLALGQNHEVREALARRQQEAGAGLRPHRRFARPLIHFIPDSPT